MVGSGKGIPWRSMTSSPPLPCWPRVSIIPPFPMHFTANIAEDNDSSNSSETDFPNKVSCLETGRSLHCRLVVASLILAIYSPPLHRDPQLAAVRLRSIHAQTGWRQATTLPFVSKEVHDRKFRTCGRLHYLRFCGPENGCHRTYVNHGYFRYREGRGTR